VASACRLSSAARIASPGTVSNEPVTTVDFYPTILELASAQGASSDTARLEGKSLVPVMRDSAAKLDRDDLFWRYPHSHPGGAKPYAAIRARDWKLIEFFDGRRAELYQLSTDIGESKDLAATHPEKVAMLRSRLHAWQKAVDAQIPVE
jgi:arylsulfatase A